MVTLGARLLPDGAPDDQVLDAFLEHIAAQNLALYPAQEEAILEVLDGKNVILATPTGSGKSLVATALHFFAMQRRERSFYTCPIKALVSEKFFALCRDFGAENVGMITGDAAVNRDAPIICSTTEIVMNMALREGRDAPVDHVVMDEFHYYADKDRGVAWQVPLLLLDRTRFLLMSATLGDTSFFEERLTQKNGRPTVTVRSSVRPVPLDFTYKEIPLHETVAELVTAGKVPVYIVNFTQRACAEEAQNLMSVDFCTKEQKKAIAAELTLTQTRFDSPYGKEIQRFVRHGIGLHHAGLLPKYRLLVEKLAQKGHLKVISGTDTLGVGVNIPIRTVLFTKLCKYDGEKTAILSVRDFQQIAGRAGRKGFDVAGSVVGQAPEHVIENLRLEAKAGSDPAKKRKIVKRKPPDRGYVHWDRATFDKLVTSAPERLESRFQISHGMLLNVLERPSTDGGGCMGVARLLKASHERPAQQRILGRTALQMFKSLMDSGVIGRDETHRVVVNADLQEDFSLHHALSLWLVETVGKLDPYEPTYALDVLTLAEAILENPDLILQKQLDRIKTEKMAEMKAAGVEYDERIAELDKLEYPKPQREFIYATFNEFARKHPWVGQDNIRPKSVAREMYERFMSFAEYVREYELGRAEGLVLRYLSDVYKVLLQTVPARAKDDDFEDIVVFFRAMVKQVDSSLLDEWEKMRDPAFATAAISPDAGAESVAEPEGSRDITRDERAFTVLVRNEVFQLVRELAKKDYDGAAARVVPAASARELATAMAPFYEERSTLRTDPAARAPGRTRIEKRADAWQVEQTLLDDQDHDDFVLVCTVDLARARVEGRPVLELVRLGAA